MVASSSANVAVFKWAITLMQENVPREPGGDRAERYIAMVESIVAAGAKKPLAFLMPVSLSHTDFSRALRSLRGCRCFLLGSEGFVAADI